MQITAKQNMDGTQLNNPIGEHIDEKGLTSGIEVLKLGKVSSHIDIKILNKESDERDQIDKGDQLEKKANVECGLTGSDEVLKLGIMSSQSCIDKDSDESDQRNNDDQIESNKAENDEKNINW